jgi:hypothetical protein
MTTPKVHIPPTNTTPEMILNPDGNIKIKGRAIDESRSKMPEPLTNWIDSYLNKPADSTQVKIALEFLNSYNTIILTSILKRIAQVTQQGKRLSIRWYYEEDDVDIFERGEYISSIINFPIEFIATDKIADC